MNESQASPTALSDGGAARLEEPPRPPQARPSIPPAPQRPAVTTQRGSWSAGRIAVLVIGVLLVLISLAFLGTGGTGLWADRTGREAGYVTSGVHGFSTAASALVTERIELGSAGTGWLYAPSLLGKVRIRVTPTTPGSALFVGIGPSADVDRYLAGVNRTLISDFWTDRAEVTGGVAPASDPGAQSFWVASSTGPGERTLTWDPANGSWTVVVMHADGSAGIDVQADLGATAPALPWIALGLLIAGLVFAAGGVLLIVGAIRRGTGRPAIA